MPVGICHFVAAAALVLGSRAMAQDAPDQGHGDHDGEVGEIVVTALLGRTQTDLLSGTSIVSGDELARELKPTIGETLTHQAGVSATSFGPNASRPVLRGFQGERVRVLADGIGSFDVSNTSVDHAVVINPLTADRIEVLRGPSALLFGSSAIGGIVNVIDSRIPRTIPDEAIHLDAMANYGSAASERSGGARIDLPISGDLVAHLDGSFARTDDLRIGGGVLSPALRAQASASPDPAISALAGLKDRLPNSAARTWEVAGGAAYVTRTFNAGFSVSRYDSLYGIPIRYSLDPANLAESVRLDVRQSRYDARAELNPDSGALEAVRFRGGYAVYRHDELEPDGAIGTTFRNRGGEARLELVQRERGGWKGATGAQAVVRTMNIVGSEKFLPRTRTQQYGVFTVQSLDFGLTRIEGGGRIERSLISADPDAILGNPALRRTFTAYSGSLGASFEFAHGWRIGLNAAYTERAPAAEELFPNGPHAGTQAFEAGDPNLSKEKSTGLEATLRGKGEGYSLAISFYHSWFRDFIFERETGAFANGLPVFLFSQSDARYYGAEVEANVGLGSIGGFAISVDGIGDFTRATLKGGGPLPRIPALRLLGGVEARSDTITGRIEVERVTGQDRIAAFETPTPGYTMTNASFSIKPFGPERNIDLTISANNIFDVVARRHASFLKDYAPLSGRDIRIGLRFSL